MFDGIETNVIPMTLVIPAISDDMLPVAALPNTPFTIAPAAPSNACAPVDAPDHEIVAMPPRRICR